MMSFATHARVFPRLVPLTVLIGLFVVGGLLPLASSVASDDDDRATAVQLAEMLRSARTVISRNQSLINDATKGDKGLTGEKVLEDAVALYQEKVGEDPRTLDLTTQRGRLLKIQMDAIVAVMADNQGTINAAGIGFKGFIPAIFARLVNERFVAQAGSEARVKVTAPEGLIRNRKARPDAWENQVIVDQFASADWPKGQPFSTLTEVDGKAAFRLLEPEYYSESCLSCHGEPAGETDITGYPKEGGHLGDLGAAISVILFR